MSEIPFEAIQAALLAQADRLLPEWFPRGRQIGREFKIGNLHGDTGESLSINLTTGLWKDFASGDGGHDLIDLRAALRHGGNRIAAARELGELLGLGNTMNGHAYRPQPNAKAKDSDDWHPMALPPSGTPRPDALLADFDSVHEYTSLQDRLTHFVGRIEAKGRQRKKFVPVTYGLLDGKPGWHRKAPAIPRPLYGLNRLSTMPGATVIICEGEKAADAAQMMFLDHACVSWFGGVASVQHADLAPLHDRNVVIWPDNDAPGQEAAAKLRKMLPRARVLRVDDLGASDDAADISVDDPEAWLAAHLLPGDAGAAETASERPPNVIQVEAGRLAELATQGEAALLASGLPIFQRGRSLVRPISAEVPATKGRTTRACGLGEINHPGMLDHLSQAAQWQVWDGRRKKLVPCDPPATMAAVILSRAGGWTLPRIAGVITTPTMRPDGSILTAPGYDSATRLYHAADPTLILSAIPQNPSMDDGRAALAVLSGLLVGFPFVTEADRAVALSALITPVVRGALPVAPLHAICASTPASGKSYLVDLAAAIATGRPCPVVAAAQHEDETEKRLVGLLLAGYPLISLDNVNGEFGGDLLCQSVERPLVRLRPLGKSEIVEIESRATIFTTGNNLRARGDMARRTIRSSLDAKEERPELRTFASDPVVTVLAHRGRYVAACLTIVGAYLAAGCPGEVPALASFAEWSCLVRSALVWLECGDPCASMEAIRADDPELAELSEMLTAWRSVPAPSGGAAVPVRDLAELAARRTATTDGFEYPEFRDVVLRVAGQGGGGVNTKRLSRWLMDHEGRIVEGYQIVRDGTAKGGVARWAVRQPRVA